MKIRASDKTDLTTLKELLFEAFFWDPNSVRPDINEFFKIPEVSKLLSGWCRPGDRMLIGEYENKIVGAAWSRLWTEENYSYGYISPRKSRNWD